MTEKLRKELDEIFNDPLLAWVNEESCKKMTEVVRDVFPKVTEEEICGLLEKFWEEEDTPETLCEKLVAHKKKLEDETN